MIGYLNFIKKVGSEARRAGIPRHAAALAFYAIYALAPMVIIFVAVGGFLLGQGVAEEQLIRYFESRTGGKAVPFLEDFLSGLKETRAHLLFSVVGLFILLYGLSHFFNTLKKAFFGIFGVHFGPVNGFEETLISFLKSATYSVFLAVFMIFLTFFNTIVPAIARFAGGNLEFSLLKSSWLVFAAVFLLTFLTLALMYKIVSVGGLKWRDALVGALFGTILFSFLNIVLSLYFNLFSSAHAVYGASSSLIAFLLWIYSVSQILLLGGLSAELSKEFSNGK